MHLNQGRVQLVAQGIGPAAHGNGVALLVQPAANALHAALGHGRIGHVTVNDGQVEPLLAQVTDNGVGRLVDEEIRGHGQPRID